MHAPFSRQTRTLWFLSIFFIFSSLSHGQERKFLQDNDSLIMKAHCKAENYRIGFGEVRTKILPAKEINI